MKKFKIVELKPQVRDKSRRTIILDNGNVFGISEDVLLSKDLHVGKILSESDLEDLQDKEDYSKVMNSALHLLEYRMRSTGELFRRLLQKGYEKKDVESVLERLKQMEYLNDEKFAIAFARDKVKNRFIGPIVLKQELFQHHLTPDLISNVIEKIYLEISVNDLIVKLIKKKTPKSGELTKKDYTRIQNSLVRKGFTWDQIRDQLNTLKNKVSDNDEY